MVYLILFLAALFVYLCLAVALGRWFQLASFHFASCILHVFLVNDIGLTVRHIFGVVLLALATFPFGWAIALFYVSDAGLVGGLLLNSLIWGAGAEWLLRRFVERPRNPVREIAHD